MEKRTPRLRALGFWFSPAEPDFPRPQALVDPEALPIDRKRVAAYLRAGRTYEQYRGYSWCRFRCGEEQMGSRDLTDGTWVWPEGLAHYVARHAVRLPEAFVEHVGTRVSPREDDGLHGVDFEGWIAWGRAQGAWVDLGAPWSVQKEDTLDDELRLELGPAHALKGEETRAVAQRTDRDDVLYLLEETDQLAVVRLTWRGRADRDPAVPRCTLLHGWSAWNAFRASESARAPAVSPGLEGMAPPREVVALGEALRRALEGRLEDGWLYLPRETAWMLHTPSFVAEPPGDVARRTVLGFSFAPAFDTATLASIVGRARALDREPPDDLLLDAFLHAFQRDEPLPHAGAPIPPLPAAARLRSDRELYDGLGEERASIPCRAGGCCRGAVSSSVWCRVHHFEHEMRRPCPFRD